MDKLMLRFWVFLFFFSWQPFKEGEQLRKTLQGTGKIYLYRETY